MWIRKPTPVTTPSMMRVRWSTVKAKLMVRPVIWIQGWLTTWITSGPPGAFMVIQSHAAIAAGGAGHARGTGAPGGRGSLRAVGSLVTKPAKGSRGMNQAEARLEYAAC